MYKSILCVLYASFILSEEQRLKVLRGIFGARGSDRKMRKWQIEEFYNLNSSPNIIRMIGWAYSVHESWERHTGFQWENLGMDGRKILK
jgi:hypothetical protein